jgi:hypothetical protein
MLVTMNIPPFPCPYPYRLATVSQLKNCLLTKLLLALASTAILASQSHGSQDHILLSDGSRCAQTTSWSKQLLVFASTVNLGSRHGRDISSRILFALSVGTTEQKTPNPSKFLPIHIIVSFYAIESTCQGFTFLNSVALSSSDRHLSA